jgi:Ni/Co efflux regulator RcnB
MMKHIGLRTGYALAALVAGVLAAGPVFADKPDWAGGGNKGKKHERDRDEGQKGGGSHQGKGGDHFTDRQRLAIREYYAAEFRGGNCPPGLAKKHNGCMPPGQAKKWGVGQPLPRDVVYYELPSTLVVKIGTPPPGYKYVRVASDILMIAVGTGMVVSAIQDLGRM